MRVLRTSVALGLLGIPAALAVSTHQEPGGQPPPVTQPSKVVQRTPVAKAGDSRRPDVVSGVVLKADGSGLNGAIVELLGEGQVLRATTTDVAGLFAFEQVPPGVYEVRASSSGFTAVIMRVAVGNLPGAPLRLVVGVRSEESDQAQSVFGMVGRSASPAATPGSTPHAASMSANGQLPLEARQLHRSLEQMRSHPDFNTASYDRIDDNRFHRVQDEPLSTFSTDVDTASYSNVRRYLNAGQLPPPDAVRVEELVNYFRFPYRDPAGGAPLGVTTEVAACPWNARHKLALVGLQARDHDERRTPARNLVFLLDVSGSMSPSGRLPLVKTAMRMLVDTLTARDRVAIVVYAGASGLALPPTPGDRKADIHRALDRLGAGGSTNGAEGIELAYDTAAGTFAKDGVNRVILATDGDFNVGVTSQGELVRLIERQRERGIFLSVLGVGDDNLKDATMEQLADRGNGNYSYLDSLDEAQRVLIAEAASTLVTVAKDVKLQVEFNPRVVAAYRLVGYENRLLAREDFNDDRKDAGDIGAGRAVTALYELIPVGEPVDGAPVDPLKYQEPRAPVRTGSRELMTVKLRYKAPAANVSEVLAIPVEEQTGQPSASLGFAAAVAQFGMLLRDSEFKGTATWSAVQALARQHRGEDADGYRAEFVRLVDLAAALQVQQQTTRESRR
jgi:Ca-activated chloride channel family protein